MVWARTHWKLWMPGVLAGVLFAGLFVAMSAGGAASKQPNPNKIKFDMVRSAAAEGAGCLSDARANVRIRSLGPVERMKVTAKGLPKKTEFDFFVLQVPDFPFGISWYQGDLETDKHGKASGKV